MLFAGACCAAGTPARQAGPAAQRRRRAAGTSSAAPPRYTQAPGGSLTFSFMQAGAESHGSFRQFATELGYDEKNLAAGSLKVTVQIASLDTQDKDRDEALRGADLFDAKKYPTAQYTAGSFAKRADGGLEAVGKLTLRGVTRDLRMPLAHPEAGERRRNFGRGRRSGGSTTASARASGSRRNGWATT